MRHFRFLVILAFPLLSWAAAAQTSSTARVGMLCPVRCVGPGYDAFDDELRKLGWVEGSNSSSNAERHRGATSVCPSSLRK